MTSGRSYKPQMSSAGADAAIEVTVSDEYGMTRDSHIAAERALTLYIGKREVVTLMTIGTEPELLILGWLRNQRFINPISDIKSIQVDWETDSAAITTFDGIDNLTERLQKRTVTSPR